MYWNEDAILTFSETFGTEPRDVQRQLLLQCEAEARARIEQNEPFKAMVETLDVEAARALVHPEWELEGKA